jgi:hypothetical protein
MIMSESKAEYSAPSENNLIPVFEVMVEGNIIAELY